MNLIHLTHFRGVTDFIRQKKARRAVRVRVCHKTFNRADMDISRCGVRACCGSPGLAHVAIA